MASDPPVVAPDQLLQILAAGIQPARTGQHTALSVMTGMNQTQADAMVAVAEAEFVRPAEEETKRERSRQRWETARQFLGDFKVYLGLAALAGLIAWDYSQTHQPNMPLVALFVVVLGADRAGLGEVLQKILKRYGILT